MSEIISDVIFCNCLIFLIVVLTLVTFFYTYQNYLPNLQVAVRNIRRDALKAYEKLEKVCLLPS